MKIDDREDALSVARHLLKENAQVEQIADALLEAHLAGIQMAQSALDKVLDKVTRGESLENVVKELEERWAFVRSKILKYQK
jgi:hypothetical protein